MSDLPTPINRNEQYLNAIATGNTVDMPAKPITREEQYLDYIARNGGDAGVSSVNGKTGAVTLDASDVGALPADTPIPSKTSDLDNDSGFVPADSALSTTSENALQNKVITSNILAIEENGAKNLAPNNASTTEMSPVTFTVNSDKTVTVNRTGNHTGWRTLVLSENVNLKAGTYILSSGYTGDEQYNVYFELADYSSGSPVSVAKTDLSDVVTFTIQTDITNGKFQIPVRPGNSVFSDVTIYPMLRDARITDPTYVPYAMTNRELTERGSYYFNKPMTADENGIITTDVSNAYAYYISACVYGNYYAIPFRSQGIFKVQILDFRNGALVPIPNATGYDLEFKYWPKN